MLAPDDKTTSQPLLSKSEENTIITQPSTGKPSYSINFSELNHLIYEYSSRPAAIDILSLSLFFLRPLSPNVIVNKLNELLPNTKNGSDEKAMQYDQESIDELLQNLWKKIVRRRNIILGILKAFIVLSNFLTPYLLDILTNNFKLDNNEGLVEFGAIGMSFSVEKSSWICSCLLISNMFLSLSLGLQYQWQMNKLKYEGRTVLQYLIYRKLIDSKPKESASNSEEAEANINNLVSTDCDTFLNLFVNFHEAWSAFACLIITLIVLYLKIRSALPVGLAVMILLLWIVSRVTKRIADVYPELMKIRDKRIGLTSDIVEGIKSIKYLCWESIFHEKLQSYREKEFACVSKIKYLDCFCVVLWGAASISIITATFISYSLSGYDLSNANIFTDIAYFQMLIYPLNYLPWTVGYMFNAKTSLERIKSFLAREDLADPTRDNINYQVQEPDHAIVVKSDAMIWSRTNTKQQDKGYFILKDIDMKIAHRSLNLVIGNISAGKTALLSSILGEMRFLEESNKGEKKSENKVIVNGSIAYVSQNPWLQKKTIRENILFGKEYDPVYYNECLKACDLLVDIAKLPGRDQYDVGLNGANLSGGQRQRISLCRALYQNADIYLLDDILSSVDVNVGSTLFKKAVIGLLKGRSKTVILVLSQYRYLKYAERILLMDKGQIIEDPQSINTFIENTEKKKAEKESGLLLTESALTEPTIETDTFLQHEKIALEEKEHNITEQNLETTVEEEEREQGEVKLKTLMAYINAMGMGMFIFIWIGGALMQISRACFEFWLGDYISKDAEGERPWFFLSSFEFTLFTLMMFSICSCIYRAVIFAYGNLKSARVMFNNLIPKVLYGKMTFFDSNPVGRIIQRFSGDTWSLDYDFAFKWNILLNEVMTFLRILFVFTTQIPVILFLIAPVSVLFYVLQKKFRKVSREVKRMDSIYSGKLFTHLAETVSGTVVIRSFKKEQMMVDEFLQKIRDNLITRSIMETMSLWFTLRLKSLSIVISSAMLVFCLYYKYYLGADFSYGQLALTLLYALTSPLNYEPLINYLSESEKDLIGIERINQYLESKTEGDNDGNSGPDNNNKALETSSSSPVKKQKKSSGPTLELTHMRQLSAELAVGSSVISFTNVSLKYSKAGKDSYALKNISLTINKNEKVALCGRTGSGKTTILNSLLRFYEIEKGKIMFCGKDIKELSKEEIRTSIAVIPQFGFMYEGTLKENLDPYNQISNEKLEKVLDKGKEFVRKTIDNDESQCSEYTESGEGRLLNKEFVVEKGGNNLSNGEKQIVNFMRILLKDTNVIFLDEATSNVDPATDELMHEALFEIARDKTLVVITHRLEYLKHYDRVVLLENGEIVDEGHYYELMGKTDGKFKAFLNEASLS